MTMPPIFAPASGLLVLAASLASCSTGSGGDGAGVVAEAEARSLLEEARVAMTPAVRRDRLERALALVEPVARDRRPARLLLIEAMNGLAGAAKAEGRAAEAAEWLRRRSERTLELLAADPADGALRGAVSIEAGLNRTLAEGWAILMEGLDTAAGTAESQTGLLRAGHVLLSSATARGQPQDVPKLRADLLQLASRAVRLGRDARDPALLGFARHMEGELLASVGRLPEAWACLWELEAGGMASAVETVRLRVALQAIGPEPARPTR